MHTSLFKIFMHMNQSSDGRTRTDDLFLMREALSTTKLRRHFEHGQITNKYRMEIAFYQAKYGQKFDKWISWFTWGPYSHVELVFSDGVFFSSSPRDDGVRFKKIEPKEDHWRFYPVDVTSQQEQIVRDWCNTKVGLPYDWMGIHAFFIPWVIRQRKEEWFCSEICITALQLVDLFPGVRPHKTTPNRMAKLM